MNSECKPAHTEIVAPVLNARKTSAFGQKDSFFYCFVEGGGYSDFCNIGSNCMEFDGLDRCFLVWFLQYCSFLMWSDGTILHIACSF